MPLFQSLLLHNSHSIIHSITHSKLEFRAFRLPALLGDVAACEQVLHFDTQKHVRIFHFGVAALKTRLIGGLADFGTTVGKLPGQIIG